MRKNLVNREVQCFKDLLAEANDAIESGRYELARKYLEDAIKSIDEIERLFEKRNRKGYSLEHIQRI